MGHRRKRVTRALTACLSLLFAGALRVLPMPWSRAVARALARAAYHCVPRIKKVGLANLDLAYGDTLSPEQKRRILRESVENVALVAAEFVHLPACARKGFEGHARIVGLEDVNAEHGVLFIGGHLGNWEWMAPVMHSLGWQVAEVVRPLDHPALNRYVDKTRTCNGIRTIPKDAAGGEVLRLLREGWMMGILIDQAPRKNAVPLEFFGAPCWATAAPALVAARAKAPIHPVAMVRQPDGSYVLEVRPPVPLVRTGDFAADLLENTRRCQAAFEALVREYPGQWLWFHRRWKTRGRLEREWAARMEKRGNAKTGDGPDAESLRMEEERHV